MKYFITKGFLLAQDSQSLKPTPRRKLLLEYARTKFGFKKVWTIQGVVFVEHGGVKRRLPNKSKVDELIQDRIAPTGT